MLTPRTCTVLLPAKKSRYVGGISGRELAGEVDVEAEAVVARAQGDNTVGDALLRGVEREGDVDLIERAGAFDAQVDRRGSLDPQQGGDDAAFRLVQIQVEIELPRRVRERGRQREVAAGGIDGAGCRAWCRARRA